VQWIQNLIDSTTANLLPKRQAVGLDIGVGASCIYPLLVCAARENWKMYGTDIDETNFQHAIHNVSANGLDERIKILKTTSYGPLIPLEALEIRTVEFIMCNPPFFATKEEATATFLKEQQPFAACTGADVEMITPGGEVAYVTRMIDESTLLKDSVQWYTVQLGKLSSLRALVQKLKGVGCKNWAVNVLQPSGQTVRWVIGWSWLSMRAPDWFARHKSLVGTGLQTKPNQLLLDSLSQDPTRVIEETLRALPLSVSIPDDHSVIHDTFIVRTDSAVWSRSARRKRQREEQQVTQNGTISILASDGSVKNPSGFGYILVVDIRLVSDMHKIKQTWAVSIRWIKGEDRAVFESFCGMLKIKIMAKLL
jgi:23S rRNA (adenine1618-N6)-methyltransferase